LDATTKGFGAGTDLVICRLCHECFHMLAILG
jgi:hypothetical protein